MSAGRNLRWFLIPLIPLISIAVIFFLQSREAPQDFLSPLFDGEIQFFPRKKAMQVSGFLPYWNMTDDYQMDLSQIDYLIYFAVMVGNDGHIIHSENGETEPGWRNLQSEKFSSLYKLVKSKHKKIELAVLCLDTQVMDEVLADPEKRQILINDITDIVKEKKFDGVNIDLEYFPMFDQGTFGPNLNKFLESLRLTLVKYNPEVRLTADVYPKAVIEGRPYDLPVMMNIIDQLIVMAYDFTTSSSNTAGPVAPIKTDEDVSIVQTMESLIGKYDPQKIILGIPLYGYEWRTRTLDYKSRAYGFGTTASYDRVKTLIEDKGLTPTWDSTASSPWLVYKDDQGIWQIYFEDLKSLAIKFELARQLKLSGIAFWAMGHEGGNTEIWDYLEKIL